jgi:Holliday junction resolvasome RuvABC ATP-dependent DNA helicase subunit
LGIVVTTAVVTTAITTALPIITAVLKLFKTHKSDKEGDDKNDTKGLNLITTTITNDPVGINTGIPTKTIEDEKEVKSYTKPLLIGSAILIGGYFLMKNKNK